MQRITGAPFLVLLALFAAAAAASAAAAPAATGAAVAAPAAPRSGRPGAWLAAALRRSNGTTAATTSSPAAAATTRSGGKARRDATLAAAAASEGAANRTIEVDRASIDAAFQQLQSSGRYKSLMRDFEAAATAGDLERAQALQQQLYKLSQRYGPASVARKAIRQEQKASTTAAPAAATAPQQGARQQRQQPAGSASRSDGSAAPAAAATTSAPAADPAAQPPPPVPAEPPMAAATSGPADGGDSNGGSSGSSTSARRRLAQDSRFPQDLVAACPAGLTGLPACAEWTCRGRFTLVRQASGAITCPGPPPPSPGAAVPASVVVNEFAYFLVYDYDYLFVTDNFNVVAGASAQTTVEQENVLNSRVGQLGFKTALTGTSETRAVPNPFLGLTSDANAVVAPVILDLKTNNDVRAPVSFTATATLGGLSLNGGVGAVVPGTTATERDSGTGEDNAESASVFSTSNPALFGFGRRRRRLAA